MAFALVTSGQASGSPTDNDTFTSGTFDTTGADLLLVNVVQFEGSSATLSDSKSNAGWVGLTAQVAVGQSQLFYCPTPTVGSGHTFTLTGTNIWGLIQIQAFSGAHASPFDAENGALGTADTSIQPGSVTPSENNCLVVSGVACELDSIVSYSIDAGFTITHQKDFENPYNTPGAMAYLVQTTAAAVNPTWSWTNSRTRASTIAVFKAAAITGHPAARRLSRTRPLEIGRSGVRIY